VPGVDSGLSLCSWGFAGKGTGQGQARAGVGVESHPITLPPRQQAHLLRRETAHLRSTGAGLARGWICGCAVSLASVAWSWTKEPNKTRSTTPKRWFIVALNARSRFRATALFMGSCGEGRRSTRTQSECKAKPHHIYRPGFFIAACLLLRTSSREHLGTKLRGCLSLSEVPWLLACQTLQWPHPAFPKLSLAHAGDGPPQVPAKQCGHVFLPTGP